MRRPSPLALALALVSSTALAQPASGVRGGGVGLVSRSELVRQEPVQRDLAITAPQRAALESTLPPDGPRGGNPREMSPDERRKAWDERRARLAEADAKLPAILDARQAARLEQIRVQALGGGVLMDREIAERLGVTDAQRDAFREAVQRARGDAGGGGAMRERLTEAAMGILTAEQKSRLDELRGPAFDVSTLQLRGRRGPRGSD